ncbi:unnamed protein product [Soboliphyme baturini]|uniref:3-phosphoinositide-dependent protein kinase 1 n=1 Tax=Soboliphyme baturini TaxID=241478 RepID=A0A183IZB1_9BILA|nr:unnamed protein product [Soboliphyme baturini]
MVSDFGSAKDLRCEANRPTPLAPRPMKRSSFVGTAQYVSPEVLNGEPCTVCCDFWAVGCVIYQLLSGRPPFRAPNEYLIFQKINKLDYTFPDGFPELAALIVKSFLKLSASERLGSPQQGGCKAIKEHPFFETVDWETLPEQTPPAMLPYLPRTTTNDAFTSTYCVSSVPMKVRLKADMPGSIEPGLDDKQLTRLLGLHLGDWKPSYNDISRLLLSKEERRKQLDEQTKSVYNRFVENNVVLKSGLLDKRKGLFARRRMFLLTEGPHLYYVDPVAMEYKGQIPWSVELRAEAKNFRIFFVHTPNRTYYLEDPSGHAPDWCDSIEQVRQHYYCNKAPDKEQQMQTPDGS